MFNYNLQYSYECFNGTGIDAAYNLCIRYNKEKIMYVKEKFTVS